MKQLILILLFTIPMIGISQTQYDSAAWASTTLDSANWVQQIGKIYARPSGFNIYVLNGHLWYRFPEGQEHAPDCPKKYCRARRVAQYISDSLMIKNNGYMIRAPFEVYPIE